MMYQLYRKNDETFIVLIAPNTIGEWYYDLDGYNVEVKENDWALVFDQLRLFFKLVQNNNIVLKEFYINFKGFKQTISSLEDLDKVIELFMINKYYNAKDGFDIKCVGKCPITNEESLDCELFGVELKRNNSVSMSIYTRNLCYLPHNPITKSKQYEVWKLNAPRLARSLESFNTKTTLSLIMEGEYWKNGGAFNDKHPFYLMNTSIDGVEDPDWDEFYMPFEILEDS